MKDDSYGSSYRETMKHSMSEPAKFRPMNMRDRRKPHYNNLQLFLWTFAGLLTGATAILIYDRLIQGVR